VGLTGLARKTVAGCVERISQLYERGADAVRIGEYVRRWLCWVNGGPEGKSHVVSVSAVAPLEPPTLDSVNPECLPF
jgi:hypothetical protein